jgi:AI-2 transport protein TqsA
MALSIVTIASVLFVVVEGAENIFKNVNKDVRKYIVIKSGASLATAALSYLVLFVAGVDFAALWGMLIFLLNFIPTVGSIVAVIPPTLLALVQFEGLSTFIIVLSSLIAIQVLIGNILEPRFAGRSLNLSPLVILLSLVFWGKILGIVGMFLCVPITVILNIILANFESTKSIAILLSANGKIANDPA